MLTTQYLEEADRLADDIVLLDHGRVVAAGTPTELKARLGGEQVAVTVAGADQLEAAADALAPFADGPVARRRATPARRPCRCGSGTRLFDVMRALDEAEVSATDIHRREATLDDVFLALTTDEEE